MDGYAQVFEGDDIDWQISASMSSQCPARTRPSLLLHRLQGAGVQRCRLQTTGQRDNIQPTTLTTGGAGGAGGARGAGDDDARLLLPNLSLAPRSSHTHPHPHAPTHPRESRWARQLRIGWPTVLLHTDASAPDMLRTERGRVRGGRGGK